MKKYGDVDKRVCTCKCHNEKQAGVRDCTFEKAMHKVCPCCAPIKDVQDYIKEAQDNQGRKEV